MCHLLLLQACLMLRTVPAGRKQSNDESNKVT